MAQPGLWLGVMRPWDSRLGMGAKGEWYACIVSPGAVDLERRRTDDCWVVGGIRGWSERAASRVGEVIVRLSECRCGSNSSRQLTKARDACLMTRMEHSCPTLAQSSCYGARGRRCIQAQKLEREPKMHRSCPSWPVSVVKVGLQTTPESHCAQPEAA